MDLTPEQTTATGVVASAARSAETSQLSRGLPVHAAEAAGGEEAYPGERGEVGGRRDGRSAVASLRDGHGKVPGRELRDILRGGHELELGPVEPDLGHPADDAYRGGDGAFCADGALRLAGDFQVLGVG